MELNKYQQLSKRTASNNGLQHFNYCLGLAGEVGEVLDYIKKSEFQGHDLIQQKLSLELGDCLWYLSNLADYYGLDLEKVARDNITKLEQRYPQGFSNEQSINRKD